MVRTAPPELNLIGLNELTRIDRWALERRSRALAQPLYLGDQTALCRILGRYKFYVRTTDIGFGAHVLMDGLWESWLSVFMASRIKPGMTVVDAGANHGYYAVFFSDLVGPTGKVAAIEPNPQLAQMLRRNIDINGFQDRTTIFEAALMDADNQKLRFLAPSAEPKNGRVVTEGRSGQADVIAVKGMRLDTLLKKWPRIDFMKIDVEGAEEAMLAGSWGIIQRDRPDLLLEFNAGRCKDPNGLLDRLTHLYPSLNAVDFESRLTPVSREGLLDTSNREDWLLYLSDR